MRRADLPAEVDRRRLSFAALVDVLGALAGERVIVRADATTGVSSDAPGLAVTGVLGLQTAGSGRVVLSIGDGGRLRLSADGVKAATLTTYDGNDFVLVRVTMPGLTVQIQDENSGLI